MNYSEFNRIRDEILRERRGVIDCGATNLYAALAKLLPPPAASPERTVHRCHLATEWTQRFGLPAECSARALISFGVRHSLELLFRTYASDVVRLWLPEDNYPVYAELATGVGLLPRTFQTLPAPQWPSEPAGDGNEVLLVTNPLKPLGRWLSADDVTALKSWLAGSSKRRVLLDTVYTFETQFHATTLELVASGQVILLHSLTKGWLHPRLFGIALVPEADAGLHTPVFRAEPPPQQNLARARELMGTHEAMPRRVAQALAAGRERMTRATQTEWQGTAAAYLAPVAETWQDLLDRRNILGIPASVFGSKREDITILSSLAFL